MQLKNLFIINYAIVVLLCYSSVVVVNSAPSARNTIFENLLRAERSTSICTPCSSEEDCNHPPPTRCVWGEGKNFCGRRECAKGPGERCGGSLGILGVCGEGMMCKADEHCYGCAIVTMDCYHGL